MVNKVNSSFGEDNSINIRGARQHNLKNIDLSLPRNKFIVFTGVSGSGKSSLPSISDNILILVSIEIGKFFFNPSRFIIIAPSQFILISGGIIPEEMQTY